MPGWTSLESCLQLCRALKALWRILRQASLYNIRRRRPEWGGLPACYSDKRLQKRITLKRAPPRQQLVQNRSKTENIRAFIQCLALRTCIRLISTASGIHDRRRTVAFGLTSPLGKGSVERFRSVGVRPNG